MVEILTIKELYSWGCENLKDLEPNCYSFEISQILEYVTGVTKAYLPLKGDNPVTPEQVTQFKSMVNRRLDREPLQYILGYWEFYGIPVKVGTGVLIPRADTEIIAETAINLIKKNGYKRCADLCSGSGAIALAIHKEAQPEVVYALELSKEALPYLTANVEANCTLDNNSNTKPVVIISDDVLTYDFDEKLDLVASNPPYIPKEDIPTLDEEVLNEPYMALEGGDDGMDFYRAIAIRYFDKINIGGAIVFEVGIHQHTAVMDILTHCGFHSANYAEDIMGIPRCVYAFR